jgi:O-succinylbenzoate synthase
VSASRRYWARDIIRPPVEVSPDGTIAVSEAPGFGYELDHDFIRTMTAREETIA